VPWLALLPLLLSRLLGTASEGEGGAVREVECGKGKGEKVAAVVGGVEEGVGE
jgi:hypothetical protein